MGFRPSLLVSGWFGSGPSSGRGFQWFAHPRPTAFRLTGHEVTEPLDRFRVVLSSQMTMAFEWVKVSTEVMSTSVATVARTSCGDQKPPLVSKRTRLPFLAAARTWGETAVGRRSLLPCALLRKWSSLRLSPSCSRLSR